MFAHASPSVRKVAKLERKEGLRPWKHHHIRIEGHVSAGFDAVRDAFAENLSRRHELGGACCVYHRGEKVVDLWGGVRNKSTGEPWQEGTMVLVHSATKGLAAMTLAVAHSRGWLDYEQRVCRYWPEFAQQGKETITVRQLLAHQAGLFAFDEPVDRSVVADLDRLAVVLARQKPAWEPGTRQAYHAITLGFHESELLRRVDPHHRSLGQFFQDEIATPLGLDFYIRLPESIPNSRLATLAKPSPVAMLLGFPIRLTLASFNRRSNIYRALVVNPGGELPHDEQRIYARNLEVPSGGGVGTARAIAHAYSVFATGGWELQLRPETLQALSAPAIPATHGFYDECLMGDVRFSLGFMKPSPVWPFGNEGSFGSPGSGGSLGFADPKAGIGYAYVTSQMGTTLTGDPRDLALRNAVYSIIPSTR
jgi:CubicO group peptidase (beta-lactamase class C family)